MTTTHYGQMLDRHAATGEMILRVQRENGTVIDVRVKPEDRDEAGRLWGGGGLSYTFCGGRAYYAPRSDMSA